MSDLSDLTANPKYRPGDEDAINWAHLRESVALAMESEGISEDTRATVLQTVDDAITNNSDFLVCWKDLGVTE